LNKVARVRQVQTKRLGKNVEHLGLNERAWKRCVDSISRQAETLRIHRHTNEAGTLIFDFGVEVPGGLGAGLELAGLCLGLAATVDMHPGRVLSLPCITVRTDQPVAACMAAQYAGWRIGHNEYFAMGSGPMRAVAAQEQIVNELKCHEAADYAVGILESSSLPPQEICQRIADDCGVPHDHLALCVAPTASMAGNIQVVARTVETAMHKMHELGFDLHSVRSGYGTAPLPPVAGNDLDGIGRTNDAVLYGGEVVLWVDAEDDALAELAPKIPSNASHDYGAPFAEVFHRYEGDFYKIDPLLFSPARVCLINQRTGRSFAAGKLREDVLRKSFGT
jgi:methenyltetrahydromethanopterin cyclohydrolase